MRLLFTGKLLPVLCRPAQMLRVGRQVDHFADQGPLDDCAIQNQPA
jgi:hypothetical protein